MLTEFFEKTFYGNTVGDWAIALGIIILSFLIAKALYWVFGKVLKSVAKRTKTKLDDLIIDLVEEPVVFALVLFGIWYGLTYLTLPDVAHQIIDNAFNFLIILNVAWFINRLIQAFIEEYLAPKVEETETDLDDQLLPILRKGLKAGIWILAVIVALNNAGYDVGAVLAGLGIGGLAFALAAQNTVANLFGGATLFADQPFTINDRIQTMGFDGYVKEIGLRSTRLRTLDGRLVTIPNRSIAHQPLTNVTSEPSRRVTLNLGLTYNTDEKGIDKAIKLLEQIVADNDHVENRQYISFNGFGDFALNILFIYFIKKEADNLTTQTEMNREILKRFNEAGLDFAFPTQTIHNIQE